MMDICGINYKLNNVACAEAGVWNILKMRIQPGQAVNPKIFDVCAIVGNISFMEWLTENSVKGCSTDAMDLAADAGHLDMVIWLNNNRTEGCTERAMDRAAGRGHLDVVKWLSENRTEGCTFVAKYLSKSNGHLDVFEWLSMRLKQPDVNMRFENVNIKWTFDKNKE